jgi:hypothetical protein
MNNNKYSLYSKTGGPFHCPAYEKRAILLPTYVLNMKLEEFTSDVAELNQILNTAEN